MMGSLETCGSSFLCFLPYSPPLHASAIFPPCTSRRSPPSPEQKFIFFLVAVTRFDCTHLHTHTRTSTRSRCQTDFFSSSSFDLLSEVVFCLKSAAASHSLDLRPLLKKPGRWFLQKSLSPPFGLLSTFQRTRRRRKALPCPGYKSAGSSEIIVQSQLDCFEEKIEGES